MDRSASIFQFLFQIVSTTIVLFIIYIEYARLSLIELDMIGMTFQAVLAATLILFTFAVCLVIGLPLRLIAPIARWWMMRQYFVLIGVAIAVVLFCLAFYPGLTENTEIILEGSVVKTELPNSTLSISGWFLLAFCMLHFYPEVLLNSFHNRIR